MSDVVLNPFEKPFRVTMRPPGSKSLSNRALVVAALSKGECVLRNVLFADDTRVMLDSLKRLGFELEVDEANLNVTVKGRGGEIPATNAELFCGNSGTTIRFLAAMCAGGKGSYVLDGIQRMRERPIGELGQMLSAMGVKVEYLANENYPPVKIFGEGLKGGVVQFGAAKSSQFLSAILLSAPYAKDELRVDLVGKQTSWPYVAMTMQLMDQFGVTPELIRTEEGEPKRIVIPQGEYELAEYQIEPDASNATYFLAAAAIREGSSMTIEGLGKRSLQGDVGFADVLHQMGADLIFGKDFVTIVGTKRLEGIDVDLSTMPDTAQTLAVVALFAKGETTMRGLHTLRVKETDRVAALQNELTKLGASVEVEDNVMTITPPKTITPAHIATYDDHRMAMSFAVAGTRSPGVTILEKECVNKTYPGFFDDLEKLRAT